MKNIVLLFLLATSANAQEFLRYVSKPMSALANFQYNSASYFTYSRYTENYEDSLITKVLIGKSIESFVSQANKTILEANKDATFNKLLLHSFLSLSNYTTNWQAIKYRTVLGKDTSSYKVLVLKFENQKVSEDSQTEISETLTNVLRLKSEAFSQFEAEKPEDEFSISELVKDTDGTLNINKLGAYLKTKPKGLEKYCDW
jgi:hypothetical protein